MASAASSPRSARRLRVAADGRPIADVARRDARPRMDAADSEGPERVAELQRARIVAAMSELVRERGVGAVTVAHAIARSRVSRRTFYELFDDRDACLLATFDHAVQRAAAVVVPAYQGTAGSWDEHIRAGLAALLGFIDEQPALGGLLVVDALAAERRVLALRARVLGKLVDAVQLGARPTICATTRGGGAAPRGARPARIVAEGVVGAVLAVVHARIAEPGARPLIALLNPLMGIVVLPYLGPAAAERELRRRTPPARRRSHSPADPLRELDMRLTYRTVRVLLAISELGVHGAPPSGRQVADASGISDQGQMSKLLTRLRHLELIQNDASRRGKGEPNAWTLTTRGREVEHAIRTRIAP